MDNFEIGTWRNLSFCSYMRCDWDTGMEMEKKKKKEKSI